MPSRGRGRRKAVLAVLFAIATLLPGVPAAATGGTVHLTVVGGGSVDADPGGDCTAGQTCDYSGFPAVFSANAVEPSGGSSGWRFSGWSGACSGTGDCSFSADASGEYFVTANFVEVYKLTVEVVGSGQVTGSRITCSTGLTCYQYYDVADAAELTLSPSAVPGYSFSSWGGDCAGSGCTVVMDSNRVVTATFTCGTATLANALANAVRAASSPVSYGSVRGCFVSLPPSGTPVASSSSVIGSFPQDGSSFGILTTGAASAAGTTNTNVLVGGISTNVSGNPVRGSADYDVTILRLDFTAATEACLALNFQFLSEEYDDALAYNDGFIAELDNSSWYTLAEEDGSSVSISADDNFAYSTSGSMIAISELTRAPITSADPDMKAASAAGTTYDGATKVLQARTEVTAGPHALFLSIFDAGDHGLDSAAFVDKFLLETLASGQCAAGATSVKYPLVVDISSPGGGTIAANGSPLTCSITVCVGYFDHAEEPLEVSLVATPASNFRFVGWAGEGCSGTDTCVVTMGDLKKVSASFVRQFTLAAPSGAHVTSVPPPVDGKYDAGAVATITPSSGTVAGWFGCSEISANGQTCTAVMNHDRVILAGSGSEALSVTDVVAPNEPVSSGDRIAYAVTVRNTGTTTQSTSLRIDFTLSDGQTLQSALPLISPACGTASGYDYSCPVSVAPGSQSFLITVDAPLVSPDALLHAAFWVSSASSTPIAPSAQASSVSTLVEARPQQDFGRTADSSLGLSTFSVDIPVNDRNPTGTTVRAINAASGQDKRATIGEVDETAAGAGAAASSTKTVTTTATSTSQPSCDTKLLLTCWRFDLDAPTLSSGYYTFTFVWDRTTFTNPDGTLQISLRKIFMYHRADGKTSYAKLASCATTGKVAYPCVKSIALQASTGDLYIVVWSLTNGQWKGGR